MKKKIISMLTALLLLIMIPVIPAAAAEKLPTGTANLDYAFTTLDGGQASSQASGKPKLLVFFMTNCLNCQQTLKSISESAWLQNGEVDVYALACSNSSNADAKTDDTSISKFKTDYCSSAGDMLKFAKGDHINQASSYLGKTGSSSNSFTTPLIAMIDADNNLCYISEGNLSADKIASDYLPALQSTSNSGTNDSQNPGSSSSSKKEDSKKDKKSSDSKPGCDHVGENVVVNNATSSEDAVSAYQCVKCGEILRYEAVPNSAYAAFLANTANSILRAQQGEVTINTNLWTSFNRSVFEAIKNRPEVSVTVNYYYKGEPYVLHIPAGINVDSLMDENGFGGFMYIQHVINTTN